MFSKDLVYRQRRTLQKPVPPDNDNQSQGKTETIDSNFFGTSQSNVGYKTMKSQLSCLLTGDEYATTASTKFSSSNPLSMFAGLWVLQL